MKSSSDLNTIPYPIATLYISSSLPLTEVAAHISRLLAVELNEDTDGQYEEFPAYYGMALQLRFAVYATKSPEAPYVLDVHPLFNFPPPFSDPKSYHTIDISLMLQAILSGLPDWNILFPAKANPHSPLAHHLRCTHHRPVSYSVPFQIGSTKLTMVLANWKGANTIPALLSFPPCGLRGRHLKFRR
jgi:hypothetical protein